jgi:hypothetical protein
MYGTTRGVRELMGRGVGKRERGFGRHFVFIKKELEFNVLETFHTLFFFFFFFLSAGY